MLRQLQTLRDLHDELIEREEFVSYLEDLCKQGFDKSRQLETEKKIVETLRAEIERKGR